MQNITECQRESKQSDSSKKQKEKHRYRDLLKGEDRSDNDGNSGKRYDEHCQYKKQTHDNHWDGNQ